MSLAMRHYFEAYFLFDLIQPYRPCGVKEMPVSYPHVAKNRHTVPVFLEMYLHTSSLCPESQLGC
jgi:hypothetical protein